MRINLFEDTVCEDRIDRVISFPQETLRQVCLSFIIIADDVFSKMNATSRSEVHTPPILLAVAATSKELYHFWLVDIFISSFLLMGTG